MLARGMEFCSQVFCSLKIGALIRGLGGVHERLDQHGGSGIEVYTQPGTEEADAGCQRSWRLVMFDCVQSCVEVDAGGTDRCGVLLRVYVCESPNGRGCVYPRAWWRSGEWSSVGEILLRVSVPVVW
jgi:hypothetical protein